MNKQQAISIVRSLLEESKIGRRLSDAQEFVFEECWEKASYKKIAQKSGYEYNYVKRLGAQIWRSLSESLDKKVSKSNFHTLLEQHAVNIQKNEIIKTYKKNEIASSDIILNSENTENKVKVVRQIKAWQDVINTAIFFGRETEIARLKDWILQDNCRIITLLGMGGIGKTTLAAKLASQLESEFQFVIWRSLRNTPSFQEFLDRLILQVSNQQASLSQSIEDNISCLLKYLRESRCLLIVDNVESILQSRVQLGKYRAGYEDYGQLFRRLAEETHQSCLIITSREQLVGIANRIGTDGAVRSLQLSGLSLDAGKEILKTKSIPQSQSLIEKYTGNPLALKIAATTIQSIFAGDVGEFLINETLVYGGIWDLLSQQFNRLSALEQTVMYWLAINREWTTLGELREDIYPRVNSRQLIEAIESLKRRSLIETSISGYTQQPVVMEYATERLIESVVEDIIAGNLASLINRAIVKPSAKQYIYQTQNRLILSPIITQAIELLGSKPNLEQQLKEILVQLRKIAAAAGYGAGNLINLFHHLQTDLAGFDFSDLTVWQADLREINLHNCNFANTDVSKSTFAENIGSIFSLAYSWDGQLLATGDTNREIEIWEVPQNKKILTLKGHQSEIIWSIAFSPEFKNSNEDKLLASGGSDRTIRIWNIATGNCLQTLEGHQGMVLGVAFSPVSKDNLLASCSEDGTIKLWDIARGKCLKTLEQDTVAIKTIAFNHDGTILARGDRNGTVKLWNVSTYQCIHAISSETSQEIPLAFSPQKNTLALGYANGLIRLWNLDTQQWSGTFTGHHAQVFSLCFSQDSQTLVSCSADCTIRIWDVNTNQCWHLLRGHTSRISAIALNSQFSTIASSGEDGTVRFWDLQQGNFKNLLRGHNSRMWSIDFNPRDRALVSGSEDGTIRFWDLDSQQCVSAYQAHQARIVSSIFSNDGDILATASYDHEIKLWHYPTKKVINTLSGANNWCWQIAFSPDNKLLASCGGDCKIHLWDVNTGNKLRVLAGHNAYTMGIAFSPDRNLLASASADNTVKLWDLATGECLKTLTGHQGVIWSIASHPNNNTLVTGSADNTVKLWDLTTGECQQTFAGHEQFIMSVAIHPDGDLIASGSCDRTIKIWDLATGKCLYALQGHDGAISSVTFCPQTKLLISGSHDETIKVWDILTGKCLKTFKATRLYEGMKIQGIIGLSSAQKTTLETLGSLI